MLILLIKSPHFKRQMVCERRASLAFRRFRRRVDYSEYGAAPLLGVAGLTLVGHGRSSAKAVRNALAMAHRFADSQFVPTLAQEIAEAAKGPR